MASQDSSACITASEVSTAEGAASRHQRRATLCMQCYQKWDVQMGRHMSKYCKEKAAPGQVHPIAAQNTARFRQALENMAGSLFFSGMELKKDTYNKYRVYELLRSFGHNAVPAKYDSVYKRVPVHNDLTDRDFKIELEEFVQCEHKRKTLEERRAAVTMKESEPDVQVPISAPTEEEQLQPDWEFEEPMEKSPLKVLEEGEESATKTRRALTYPGTLYLKHLNTSFFFFFFCLFLLLLPVPSSPSSSSSLSSKHSIGTWKNLNEIVLSRRTCVFL